MTWQEAVQICESLLPDRPYQEAVSLGRTADWWRDVTLALIAKTNYGSAKPLKLTYEFMESCRSHKGGWTRATLAEWGVPWPPPAGWRRALLNGRPIPKRAE